MTQERASLLHSIRVGHPVNTEMGCILSLVHPTPLRTHTRNFSLLHQELEAWWSDRSGWQVPSAID